MIRNKCVLAVALVLGPLATQAAETIYTFDTVTGVEHRDTQVLVTGVLVNDSVPTTVTLPWMDSGVHRRCESLFNVVLSQPAAHRLIVVTELVTGSDPLGPYQVLVFRRCASQPQP